MTGPWEGRWHLTQARKRLIDLTNGSPDPMDALAAVDHILWELDKAISAYVDQARDQGRSWGAIGRALGMSRQAAWNRFGRPTVDVGGAARWPVVQPATLPGGAQLRRTRPR